MASAPSPIADMLRSLTVGQLGSPGGGGGGQPNVDAVGSALSGEYSQLQGADPGRMLRDLAEIKSKLGAMFPVAVERVADMAKGISQAVTGINAAMKAAQKAQDTLKSANPGIGLTAAQPQPNAGGAPGLASIIGGLTQ